MTTIALAGLLAVVVVAAGCGSTTPAMGVTVDGQVVTRDSIDGDLDTIRANAQLLAQIGGGAKTLPAEITAAWVTAVVETEVAAQQVRRRHVNITNDDRAAAKQWAESYFGSAAVFGAFPKSFQDAVTKRYASVPAIVRTLGKPPTEAEIKADYDTSLQKNCPSGRFVSHILVATKAEADAIEQQLKSGANFEQLALAKSTDSGSASKGGALGCIDPSQTVAPFASAMTALPLGTFSAPVQTQYGWHVIKAEDVHAAVPLAAVSGEIRTDLIEHSAAGQQALVKLVAKAKVRVDGRYGRWVVTDGQGKVEPPASSTSTTTTAPGTATTTAPGTATTTTTAGH
jgi:parvulin-like peptidyl-prolyl isomerase